MAELVHGEKEHNILIRSPRGLNFAILNAKMDRFRTDSMICVLKKKPKMKLFGMKLKPSPCRQTTNVAKFL